MGHGGLGVPGGPALNHVVLEQEKDLGAATIPLQGMEEKTALGQTLRQDLATQEHAVQVDVVSTAHLDNSII